MTEAEKREQDALFVMPEEEKDPVEIKKTKRLLAFSIPMGFIITVVLILLWVVPYTKGLK